jgi:Flp pilus assembly pilin Flp
MVKPKRGPTTGQRQSGQGLPEYALILTLITIAVMAALTMMSGSIEAVLNQVAKAL